MKMLMKTISKTPAQIEQELWDVYQTALHQLDFSKPDRFDKAQLLYDRYLLDLDDAGIIATMTGYQFAKETD